MRSQVRQQCCEFPKVGIQFSDPYVIACTVCAMSAQKYAANAPVVPFIQGALGGLNGSCGGALLDIRHVKNIVVVITIRVVVCIKKRAGVRIRQA